MKVTNLFLIVFVLFLSSCSKDLATQREIETEVSIQKTITITNLENVQISSKGGKAFILDTEELYQYFTESEVLINQLRYLKERNMPFVAHVEKKNDSILYISDKQ